jgi:hypothetical protein
MYDREYKYDYLDEDYEHLPAVEKVHSPTKPVGSLSDNARKIKPVRDSAHKRMNSYEER